MKSYAYTAFGGPETQQFIDLPKPVPGEGQVLIKVRTAGVNPADWRRRRNLVYNSPPLTEPQQMGLEAAGVVEATGPGVEGFSIGDEVFGAAVGSGGYSEFALLEVIQMARKPTDVSFDDAGALSVAGATAYDGVEQLQLSSDDTLLILGIGGGVGIAAAQIARADGARVIGTASESKKALVESIGATHVPYGDGVVDRVRAAAPKGVNALYDMVGGDALRELAGSGLVTDPSRIVTIVGGSPVEEYGGSRVTRTRTSEVLEALAQMVSTGTLKPFVTATFPFDEVGAAIALVESGHSTGKVVVEVS